VDPERAQTHLRLLAEAELRHASAPNGEIAVPVTGRNSARLARVAQALIAVGALDAAIAEAILAGDGNAAARGMRRHVNATLQTIMELPQSWFE